MKAVISEGRRVSVKSDLEKIAKRIHVGSANKLALEKLINVYFHPSPCSGSGDHSRPTEISAQGTLIKDPPSSPGPLYYPWFIYSL